MPLKIRVLSDIHAEFGPFDLPDMKNENEQVLILAGDVGLAAKSHTYVPYLEDWSERFRDVIYIMGNHEFYGSSLLTACEKIKQNLEHLSNVHVIEQEVVRIEDVSFICATLWTSYHNGNALVMMDSQTWMNDYKKIRTGPSVANAYQRPTTPSDLFEIHVKTKNWLFAKVVEEKEAGQKVCVVTHHLPSYNSIHPTFRTGNYHSLNGAYYSDLEYDIAGTQPNLFIHGHTHFSFDYMIEDTRILCNPRGYHPDGLNLNFNPNLLIDL